MMEIWQITELDRMVAEEFFGWRWMAFIGTPTRSHPDYPKPVRVRQFMSPEGLASERWLEYWRKHDGAPAYGNEPLSYRYCSSMGPAQVPHFSGNWNAIADLEQELRGRELWNDYRQQLWSQVVGSEGLDGIDEGRLAAAGHKARCIAALAVVGSKFAAPEPCEATA